MEILRPRWSSASLLVYAGGFTIAVASSYALTYLATQYGPAAYTAWSLLVLAVLLGLAIVWRTRHSLTAGVLAFVAVGAFAGFVDGLWAWFGWSIGSSPFAGFHAPRLFATLLVLLFAVVLLRRFRHPLLALPVAFLSWFFVTDLISNGGGWTAVVSAFVALALLLVAVTLDRGARRPYGFWVHVVSGLTLGGALVYWWHSGTWHWIFVALGSFAYVRVATATGRSSWAVLGALGLLAAAIHFAVHWSHQPVPLLYEDNTSPAYWVPPVVLAVLGFVYLALGAIVSRREPESPRPSAG